MNFLLDMKRNIRGRCYAEELIAAFQSHNFFDTVILDIMDKGLAALVHECHILGTEAECDVTGMIALACTMFSAEYDGERLITNRDPIIAERGFQ